MLTRKEHKQYLQNVMEIPGEFQHAIVVVGMERNILHVMRNTCSENKNKDKRRKK